MASAPALLPGTYIARTDAGPPAGLAVLIARTAAGTVSVQLPVLAATVVVSEERGCSWFEVDLDGSGARSSVPGPLGKALARRLAAVAPEIRLESFELELLDIGRGTARTDLRAGDATREVTLTTRLLEASPEGLRAVLEGNVPRELLATDARPLARVLVSPRVRLICALVASQAVPGEGAA